MDPNTENIIDRLKNSPNKGVYFLFGCVGVLIIIIIIVVISLFSPQQKSIVQNFPAPTPVRQVTSQKTIINKTTEKEFLTNAQIIKEGQTSDGGTKYTIKSVNPVYPDEVIFKNGIAIFERTSTQTSAPGGYPKIEIYKKQLGQPEEEIYGNKNFALWISSYLYPTKGYVIIGNKVTGNVYEVQKFTPMSLSEYKKQYGNYIEKVTEIEGGP